MKAEEGWRCEGDAAPGPYSTSTARMLLPGTLGNSPSKTFDTFVAGAFISCAAPFVDSSEALASSSKAIFVTATLLLMRGFSAGSALCAIIAAIRGVNGPNRAHALFPYKGSLWDSSVERGRLEYSSQELPQRSAISMS